MIVENRSNATKSKLRYISVLQRKYMMADNYYLFIRKIRQWQEKAWRQTDRQTKKCKWSANTQGILDLDSWVLW